MDANTSTSPLQVALVGRSDSPEMQPVRAALSEILPDARIIHSANVATAVVSIAERTIEPDLIVVCQHWSDEYSSDDVHALIAHAPLARLICCHDSWCESDGRNRDLWPAAVRASVPSFARRLRHEAEVLRGTRDPLPLTGSRDESYSFDYGTNSIAETCSLVRSNTRRIIQVHTPDRELERWLIDLLNSAGHEALTFHSEQRRSRVNLILWDLDPWDPARIGGELKQIEAVNHLDAPVTIIGLLGLMHPEDAEVTRSLGIDSLLTKLSSSDEILAAVA